MVTVYFVITITVFFYNGCGPLIYVSLFLVFIKSSPGIKRGVFESGRQHTKAVVYEEGFMYRLRSGFSLAFLNLFAGICFLLFIFYRLYFNYEGQQV